jgi:hypothetical protein
MDLFRQPYHLGFVELQRFHPLHHKGAGVRLNSASMVVGHGLELTEINLEEHEGKALLVRGDISGDWLYNASIIDQGGPILAVLIKEMLALLK